MNYAQLLDFRHYHYCRQRLVRYVFEVIYSVPLRVVNLLHLVQELQTHLLVLQYLRVVSPHQPIELVSLMVQPLEPLPLLVHRLGNLHDFEPDVAEFPHVGIILLQLGPKFKVQQGRPLHCIHQQLALILKCNLSDNVDLSQRVLLLLLQIVLDDPLVPIDDELVVKAGTALFCLLQLCQGLLFLLHPV